MKRAIFNTVVVLAGLPLLGGIFLSIASVHPVSAPDSDGRMRVASVMLFLTSLVVFAWVWRVRARWVSSVGAFQSFAAFRAFLAESHCVPPPPEEIVREFRIWIDEHSDPLSREDEFDPDEAGKKIFAQIADVALRRRLLMGLLGHLALLRTADRTADCEEACDQD
jgi:hypothetical protein